jgi:hypothetical protein
MFLLKKYSGASTIFATIKLAIYLIIVRDKLMTIFVFDSSRFKLQKTVFRFEIAQTITEISLCFPAPPPFLS